MVTLLMEYLRGFTSAGLSRKRMNRFYIWLGGVGALLVGDSALYTTQSIIGLLMFGFCSWKLNSLVTQAAALQQRCEAAQEGRDA